MPSGLSRTEAELAEEDRVLLVMLSRARHAVILSRARSLISNAGNPYNTSESTYWQPVAGMCPMPHDALEAHIAGYKRPGMSPAGARTDEHPSRRIALVSTQRQFVISGGWSHDGQRQPPGRASRRRLSVPPVRVCRMQAVAGDRAAARVITSAALRAAVAWTRREEEPRAWRELSRMTGVLMYALGPGQGPSTPLEVVELLRHPLAKLLGSAAGIGGLGDLVFLDEEDRLTPAAVEVGCEYTEALFATEDPGQGWLPSWAWQRAEQVQRRVFETLISSGTEEAYSAARRFLIENPAGDESELTALMNAGRIRRAVGFGPIPADRVHRSPGGACWWPCPVCGWPMAVRGDDVACGYSHHQARFRADTHGAGPAAACEDIAGPDPRT